MDDKRFLEWLVDRLANQYGESKDTYFVRKLKAIADATTEDVYTRW